MLDETARPRSHLRHLSGINVAPPDRLAESSRVMEIVTTPTLGRRIGAALTPVLLGLVFASPVGAQQQPPQPQQTPQQSPACTRLEAQLAAFERTSGDAARAEQVKKYEAAAAQQQAQLDRLNAQSKKTGCEGTGFFLFGGQPAACGPLNAQIQQMRGNLDRIQADLSRLQGDAGPERDGQRRALIGALAQNDCGPQYRQAAAAAPQPRGGLFESLFGPGNVFSGTVVPGDNTPAGSGYRTVCVRTCDGYYYPISYSTSPNKFLDDEKTCQASCPAAEVQLFAHRNPGEDINQAVSTSGQLYTALPNAFKYRQAFDQACSCRRSGESWSQALKNIQDPTVAPGDVVVNEERARQMSQPRVDAQGKPIKAEPLRIPPKPDPKAAKPAETADDAPAPVTRDPNRPVRSVGPTFIAR
jgi:hypothetical protein